MRLLAVLRQFVHRASDTLMFVFREGSWSLKMHELAVLNAVLSKLDNKIRPLIEKQLEQSFFVERIPKGRINVFRFYNPSDELRVPVPEFVDSLFRVKLFVAGKQQTAHVIFYKGYLYSVEFKKPGSFYVGKDIVVGEVEEGALGQSYTQAIDRFEHGKPE